MSHAINEAGRQAVARLMTELCDAKISSTEFVNAVCDLRPQGDRCLDMVLEWITDTFEPDLGSPGFDLNRPPLAIHRQLALFRRFLLSGADYRWPKKAFRIDAWPTLRLWTAGIACAGILLLLPLAVAFPSTAPLWVLSVLLAMWILLREKAASKADVERINNRARHHGDPNAWPFLSFSEFRQAGPSRRLWKVAE